MHGKNSFLSLILIVVFSLFLVGCTQKLAMSEETYETTTDVSSVVISEKTMPVRISQSENVTKVTIHYYEVKNKYECSVQTYFQDLILQFKRIENTNQFAPEYTYSDTCLTEVIIPVNYAGLVKVTTSSGRITVNHVSTGKLELKTNDGSVKLLNTTLSEESTIVTTSGDITVDNATLNKTTITSTSGKILVKNSTLSDYLIVKGTNSDIDIEKVKANAFDISDSNGFILMQEIECDTLVNILNTTGNITLSLVGKKGLYTTTIASETGEKIGITTGGDKIITAKTTVGDVKVTYLG